MKKSGILFKTLVLVALLVLSLSFSMPTVSALSVSQNKLEIITDTIPTGAIDYAKNIAPKMLSGAIENQSSYNIAIDDPNNLRLGTPYTIFKTNNNSLDRNDIYYFPIIENTKIKLILSVYQVNGEWNATLGKDISEQLNNLQNSNNTSQPYLLYVDNKKIFAQNDDNFVLMKDGDTSSDKSNNDFLKASFKQKKTQLEKNSNKKGLALAKSAVLNTNNSKIIIKSNQVNSLARSSYYPGFSKYTSNEVQLNMANCLVNQQDASGTERGMCWAAAVATIVRYRTGNTTLRAYNVADRMGIGYDQGGTIIQARDALTAYYIGYSAINRQITFGEVMQSIQDKYPVYMHCINYSYTASHVVTLTGYSTFAGLQQISFWNSGSHAMESCLYNSSGSTFAYYGNTFIWRRTVD